MGFEYIRMRLRLRFCPGPRWGSLQCFPDSLTGFKGPLRVEGQEEGKGRREETRNEGKREDRMKGKTEKTINIRLHFSV